MDIRSSLQQVHEDYFEYVPLWEFWEDSSIGGHRYASGNKYLIEHPREKDEPGAYDYRSRLATYESHGSEIAEDWIARLFGPGLDFSIISPTVKQARVVQYANAIMGNIDLLNNDIINFCKKVSRVALAMGSCGVAVDVTPGREANNLAEAFDVGLRPYCRTIMPQNILDWQFDSEGQLEWVKIRERAILPRRWNDSNGNALLSVTNVLTNGVTYRYFIIDKETIRRYEPVTNDQWAETSYVHGLGSVPFQMFYWRTPESGRMFQNSLLEEVYGFDKLIFNMRSGLCDLMFNQMFPIFVMALTGPQKDAGSEIGLGARRALGAPGGAGFPPFYVSPDSSLVTAHLEAIKDCESAIKRLSKGVGMTLVDDKVREASGRAKAFDSDPLSTMLREAGDTQEPAFMHLLELIHRRSPFANEEFTGRSKFPDSIVLRGVLEEREDTSAVCEVLAESETACRLIKQHFARQVLRSIWRQDEMDQVMNEIKGAPIEVKEDGNQSGTGSYNTPTDRQPDGQEQRGPRVKAN